MEKKMRKRRAGKIQIGLAVILIMTGSTFLKQKMTVKAAAPYDTAWKSSISWEETIMPVLQKTTDANVVYRELKLAIQYRVMSEGDILDLYQTKGARIPEAALKKLSDEGYISGYLYKYITKQAMTADDMKLVFDADYYYANNPLLQGALPDDKEVLFQNFLTAGMQAGLAASPSFNLAYYKANNPDLVKALGDNNTNYYIHYILYGRFAGLVADHLVK